MVITVINGGANSGGQTVITNGDGTGADASGLSVTDQKHWAWNAAKDCATARRDYVRRTRNGNINYAMGFLQDKFMSSPERYGPILGKGKDQSGHSEQKIIDYWSKIRLVQLRGVALQSGDHLILLIFSRVNVCDSCLSTVPKWITDLAAIAGPGVTIHFYVWESVNSEALVGLSNLQTVAVS